MTNETQNILVGFFKATGQAERLKILGLLALQPRSTTDLVSLLKLKRKTVVRHLHALEKAGLIIPSTVVESETYQFSPTGLADFYDRVTETTEPEDLAARVLQQYVVAGRLVAIPRQPEERHIIFQWLVSKFEPDRRYTETEVNDLVGLYYDQPLTLRRILADKRFLYRTGRHYWRPLPEDF